MRRRTCTQVLLPAMVMALTVVCPAQTPAMVRGIGWRTDSIFAIGDSVGGFQPTGQPDGIGAFPMGNRVLVLVNSEIYGEVGYTYSLRNGTKMTGARITAYEVQRFGHVGVVFSARVAYDTAYDRAGKIVTHPRQINEANNSTDGFERFCSARAVRAGTYGFVDDIFFTHEEARIPSHRHGGSVWALDVKNRTIWAAPALGRAAWENVAPIDTGSKSTVGLLLGDDSEAAPLYLYLGKKNSNGNFLDRNGLLDGQLYYWVADNGDTSPQKFNGQGSKRSGKFVAIAVRDARKAGNSGYDVRGYLDEDTLRKKAQSGGAFQFSRPEDLHTNPKNGLQVVFASTGQGSKFPADNWGTVYRIDLKLGTTSRATLEILHDADGLSVPDRGIRNPDNVTWASDGYIYVQEDRATEPKSLFGKMSKIESSIWQLDPATKKYTRIGVVNRSVLFPGTSDSAKGEIGVWETSGIVDVTDLFPTGKGETLLIATCMAHSVTDGPIGGNKRLFEGGQLFFLSNKGLDHAIECADNPTRGTTITVNVTNGTPNNVYAMALAAANAGKAPFGWFFGIDVTPAELLLVAPPLIGVLDSTGSTTFSGRFPGSCPVGLVFDAVVLDVFTNGALVQASPAVTHRL